MALSPALIKSTVVAALGGLLFGFDTAVIAGVTGALTTRFALTPSDLGFTVASALVGTIIGAMTASLPGDRIGRRDSLRFMAVLYLISAIGCAIAWDWNSLVFFRLIGGLGIGGSSVLGPMYIAEIAPAKWRGRLVGFFQFNVVAGILVAYLSNYLIGLAQLGAAEWRWKLGVAAIPAAFFFLMLFTIPRSPRWLVQKNRMEEARLALRLIGEDNIDSEIRDMVRARETEREHGKGKLFTRAHWLPVFLAVSIGAFNQLSGINAILYYLNDIFAKAGFSKVSSDVQAVAIGATNLFFTMLAMSLIDKVGRKTLLIIGSVGCSAALAGAAAIFFSGSHESLLVWLLVGFIAFFAFSQGAVIWVYISEVFPTNVRAKGQSLGSLTHWTVNAAVTYAFPVIAAKSKGGPFVFFSVMMIVQLITVIAIYPETKGATLEEMGSRMIAHH
jgi:SP family arabinose:H+ symporter-like MFS transporter